MTTTTLDTEVITDYATEDARVFVITRTRYLDEDGALITEKVHRRPIEPDASLDGESAEVAALANLVRTPERLERASRPEEGER